MSRYEIPSHDPAQTVTVGWDNPLSTFFANVCDYSLPQDQDHVLFWIGCSPRGVKTVEQLQELLSGYATLTEEMVNKLRWDYAHREPITPLQQHMLKLLTHIQAIP
jgi:hypothetical protein